ncbi:MULTISPECIES: sulfite exporter TauE/SafE family protein [unclassified Arthrobacter]|uniref:sulfite exporter TauE/SafE family protein n=1 Tax=unclassified Arthrobacter TaxID=235627 RepID=UPI000424670E|nr:MULTISPECIES: sulfite exporter TauE/SafE family protein [unclassified Arthrobacter]MBE0010988.1 sulfite exporter TauE/SafE family protein [Arthrobacter sp. AET 35A]
MSVTLLATVLLSVVIGISLGLLGGGGSILTVPILTYVAGLDPKEAIAASLFVVGVTSAVSAIDHARKKRVKWRTGLVFGAAGMAGAFGGGLLGGRIPGTILMIAFALMMVATSIAMIRGRKNKASTPHDGELPILKVIIEGLIVGLVTGLVGAGGGFLVVPALALLGGLSMPIAVGTSLVVIAMKSFAGLAGYLTTVTLDWGLVAAVTAAAVVGSLIGSRLAGRIPEAALRKGFGIFVLVMGVFVLVQELPAPWGTGLAITAGIIAVATAACWFLLPRCPLRTHVNPQSSSQPGGTTPQ